MTINLIFISTIMFIVRLYSIQQINFFTIKSLLNRVFLSFSTFFFSVSFFVLNYLLDFYKDIFYLNIFNSDYGTIFQYSPNKLFMLDSLSCSIYQVYTYPFIYVFILVTMLSIIYCLSYNTDELYSFMFYIQIILTSGYILFFTDSLILFFFAYEMLLIPSFFILYKFAKTRRCVEAAYLMFF